MASASAVKIAVLFKRKLTRDEWLHVEEMVLNFYPTHVFNYLQLVSRRRELDFEFAYYEIMNGQLRNSDKFTGNRKIVGGLAKLYDTFERVLPHAFRDSELAAIVDIYEDCTPGEVEKAIEYTVGRGIRSARYCYKVIISLREKKKQLGRTLKELEVVDVSCKVHDVDRTIDAWRDRQLSSKVKKANARTK